MGTSALARISATASTTLPRTSRRWTMPRRRVAVATGTCLVARFYPSAVSHSEDAVAVWWHALSRRSHPYFAHVYAAGYSGAHMHTAPCNGLWITLSALCKRDTVGYCVITFVGCIAVRMYRMRARCAELAETF